MVEFSEAENEWLRDLFDSLEYDIQNVELKHLKSISKQAGEYGLSIEDIDEETVNQMIDNYSGVEDCPVCYGSGYIVETVQDPVTGTPYDDEYPCTNCGGSGKI